MCTLSMTRSIPASALWPGRSPDAQGCDRRTAHESSGFHDPTQTMPHPAVFAVMSAVVPGFFHTLLAGMWRCTSPVPGAIARLCAGDIVVRLIRNIVREPVSGRKIAAIMGTLPLAVCFFAGALMGLAVCLLERRPIKPRLRDMCTMGLYIITWIIANLAGFCLKAPGWKAIPHVNTIGIEDLGRDDHVV